MPLHVKCPGCGSVLAVADEQAGGAALCPQCRSQFMVPGKGAGAPLAATVANSAVTPSPSSSPPASPVNKDKTGKENMYPPGLGSIPVSSSAPPVAVAAPRMLATNPPPAVPTKPARPATPVVSSSGAGQNSAAPITNAYPPGATPPLTALAPLSVPTMPVSTAPPSLRRQTQAAKFIAADATATRLDLGADGKLPELKLEEIKEQDDLGDKKQASSPWLLIGVLGLSIGASVLMLFIDPEGSSGESLSKGDARRAVQYYVPDRGPFKPYQERLRRAALAFNHNDRDEERRHYRAVRNMLQAENNNDSYGLTGTRGKSREEIPSDRHLEHLLSILLSDN